MPKCPVCGSQRINKNEYGFECLRCFYQNNKEFLNDRIKSGEIKVEFAEKPKTKKKKPSEGNWLKKVREEIDKAEEDWKKVYFDVGETSEDDLKKLTGRMITKFKRIRNYIERFESDS
jgi:uncharacterized Fe-S cluster-containing protein